MKILIADTMWLGLALVDWMVLAVYFVVILSIGIWSISKVKNMTDFFMGGRRFGKVFMMFFAFGAGTSSDQAISVVAGTWRVGLAGIWWQFLWLWATPFYWIVAPVMRRMRALTTADFFESRFNTATATLYTIYGIVISIVFIAMGLFGSGKMVEALTGGELAKMANQIGWQVPDDISRVPVIGGEPGEKELLIHFREIKGYEYAILAMTILFVAYGMAGGLGAAIITDLIQGILTIIFSFLLLPFVFFQIGGFGKLHGQASIKEGMLDLVASAKVAESLGREPITIFYVCMLAIVALSGIVVQPHIMGVCGAGKTEYEGRFGFTVGNFLKRFCTVAWTFTGLACIVWYLGSHSPMLHEDKPLSKESVVAFAELDKEKQTEQQTAFDALPEKEREKILADRKIFAAVQLRNEKEEYNKLSEAAKKSVDKIDKEFSDRLFGIAAYDILPTIMPGLVGLLLASLLAAVMSTSDAQMIISSGLFTENIYRRFLVKNKSDRHYLWAGRIAGLLIVVLAIVMQTTFQDVIDALKIVIQTPAFIGISLWFGISWRRWNAYSVWVSTFTGIIAWMILAHNLGWLIDSLNWLLTLVSLGWVIPQIPAPSEWGIFPELMFNTKGMTTAWQMFCYMFAGISSGVIISFITPMQSKEKLDHFFRLMHTPVTPGEEVPGPCQLPENPAPVAPKMFANSATIEIPKPTQLDIVGFVLAWIGVAAIIGLTMLLANYL